MAEEAELSQCNYRLKFVQAGLRRGEKDDEMLKLAIWVLRLWLKKKGYC